MQVPDYKMWKKHNYQGPEINVQSPLQFTISEKILSK